MRGLAIILVVLFHSERFLSSGELVVVQFFNEFMLPIRMPLFSAIGGFVYGMRPLVRGSTVQFIQGKARRLLLPIITIGLLTFVVKISPPFLEVPDRLTTAWRVVAYPDLHLWYPMALFAVLVLVACVERMGWLRTVPRWIAVTTVGSLMLIPLHQLDDVFRGLPFSIGGALYLFPFFLFGLGIQRFPELMGYERAVWTATIIATGSCALYALAILEIVSIPHPRISVLACVVGASTIAVALRMRKPVRWLSVVGAFSYGIFLFHLYIIDFINVNLPDSLSLHPAAVFLLGAVLAVVVSILVQRLVLGFRIPRLLFLGLK